MVATHSVGAEQKPGTEQNYEEAIYELLKIEIGKDH